MQTVKRLVGGTAITGLTAAYTLYMLDDWPADNVWMPIVRNYIPPEAAHLLALNYLKVNLIKNQTPKTDTLEANFFGVRTNNPLGIAAGFDKHCEAIDGLQTIGFGFVEVGSVTPLPQPGNPKPRVFRMNEERAVINRYGFNSVGLEEAVRNLAKFDLSKVCLGVNLGKNKEVSDEDAKNDYITGVRVVEKSGLDINYFVINVSSPNTPGLRKLQESSALEKIILAVQKETTRPIFLKISPDISNIQKNDIAKLALQHDVSGLIVSNTTIDKTAVSCKEQGGLSGRPLKEKSTELLKEMYHLTQGKICLIGVGGVGNGKDALEKIKNGATFVQLYTSMMFDGFPVVRRTLAELDELVKQEGASNYKELIGVNCK